MKVRSDILHFSDQQDIFQQLVDTDALARRDRNADDLSTIFFDYDANFCQLLLNTVRVSIRLIYLIECDNNRYIGSLGVVDGFDCLGHDTIVSGYNDNRNMGNLSTTRTHSGKCFVAGSIQESNFLAINLDLVSTHMLSDTASFV